MRRIEEGLPAPIPSRLPLVQCATGAALVDDPAALAHVLGAPEGAESPAHCVELDEWLAGCAEADETSHALARRLALPMACLERLPVAQGVLALLAPETARRLRAVPLAVHEGRIAVAMEDPGDPQVIGTLGFLLPQRVVPLVGSERGMREAIARHYDRAEDEAMARQLGIDLAVARSDAYLLDVERLASEKPVVRVVEELIGDAVARRASDIHLRPGERGLEVLYRIDDELVGVRRFLHSLQAAIVSRVKVLGGMNLAEHRRPQDGRSTFVLPDGRKVDLRVSVLPAIHGESVVVRLLDPEQGLWGLDQVGLTEADRQRLDDVMARSHGMFLATGPTGCGKSTTLYAMLMELRRQRINILTIEDPVEMHVADVQQMQVNRAVDFTFAGALRNFLRHDPDVIMVGEIRDRETATIAVESALTGHLVLSTLHTNTAATTVTRLLDLGVEAYLLRSSLLAVMAQRLVRLTCTHCREVEQVDPRIREGLGVGADEVFLAGRGCSHCEGLGVHKRQAVYELMVMSARLRALVVAGADADALHRAALDDGMTPITQAAVTLARQGAISLAEAWRVRAD
jgi:type IV pilus assembly protein PilB